jgi:hypothetical protein
MKVVISKLSEEIFSALFTDIKNIVEILEVEKVAVIFLE